MDAMQQADRDWDEILATHRAVCEEPQEEKQICAVCKPPPGARRLRLLRSVLRG
jgi:hypothetical protein